MPPIVDSPVLPDATSGHACAAPETGASPGAGATRRARGLDLARRVALVALYPVYPALILGGLYFGSPRAIALILLVVFWLQRMLQARSVPRWIAGMTVLDWSVFAMLTLGSLSTVVTDSEIVLRCYPALVNLGLLVSFGATLVRGPTMIERFARAHNTEMTPQVIRHTRRVTQWWCAMFLFNGTLATYTAFACSREVWAAFNGLISYGLVGALIVGEWVYRKLFVARHKSIQERSAEDDLRSESQGQRKAEEAIR